MGGKEEWILGRVSGRSNVNSVKRKEAMSRPKEQVAGWINVEKEKRNYRRVGENGRNPVTFSAVMHPGHFNLLLYSAKVATVANC